MKRYLIFFVLLTFGNTKSQAQTNNFFICFEHIGEGDNPLTPIHISTENRVQGYDTIFIMVNKKEFKIIQTIITGLKKETSSSDPGFRHFGIYRITLKRSKRSKVYFLDTKDKSLLFLSKMRNQIKDAGIINEKLDSELNLNIYSLKD